MHKIMDYIIYGEEMQYLEINLSSSESVVAEAGGFMMMEDGIQMKTIFGDGTDAGGIMDKLFSAGKRLLTGESLFMTLFQNTYSNQRKISFASPYPGKILPIDLNTIGGKFICQKDAFLCANQGVKIGIEFSRKLGRGLFGGEGFIMQRLEGSGLAFIHAGGTMAKIELHPGEMIKVDTGCVVGFTQTVDYDVQLVGGIRNTIFGGEGLFFATLKGPGTVYVQSLPFSRLAGRIWAVAPQGGGKHKGEGSLLGGLGNLLDGDNR
ncbi:MAG TPA: TIGR00266 family protein [Flavobacterium sp.]|nr:TIGR00266 family protein [Flavobacterium sp.]